MTSTHQLKGCELEQEWDWNIVSYMEKDCNVVSINMGQCNNVEYTIQLYFPVFISHTYVLTYYGSLFFSKIFLYNAGSNGITEVTVGVAAVFDGHNGAEASEMASKLLLQYFTLHTFFLLDATFSVLSRKMIGLLPNERGQSTLQDLNWELDELKVGRSLLQAYTLFFFIVLLKANTIMYQIKLLSIMRN